VGRKQSCAFVCCAVLAVQNGGIRHKTRVFPFDRSRGSESFGPEVEQRTGFMRNGETSCYRQLL